MARARLLLDEDVPLLLAEALRARRHDVVHAQELHLKSAKDPRVLAEAVSRGRAVLTHNITDYLDLATHYGSSGTHHHGIVIARRMEFRELLRRAQVFMATRTAEDLRDAVAWLQAP